MLGFVGLIIVVIGLVHFYLWKRLVKDPLRAGWARRAGTILAVVLGFLVPTTLIGVRSGHLVWLAWPGYLWVALMFYLLVTLVVLEIPRLALVLSWKARRRTEKGESATGAVERESHAAVALTAADADAAGRSMDAAGRSMDAAGRSMDAAGRSMDAAGRSEDAAGRSVDAAGRSMDAAGRSMDAAGRREDAAGRSVDAAGASADGTGDTGLGHGGSATSARESADASSGAGEDDAGASTGPPADEGKSGVERRLVLARGMAIFAGLTAAGVTGYGVKTALGGPQLDRVQLPLAKLPRAMDGTRLAVVSDIHLGPLTGTRHAGRIVDLINSVQADIVCVVGDLVDGSVAELGRFAAPLAQIQSRHGAFFVTGNHEYYSGYQEWVEEVARLNVRPLRNERVQIAGLDLAGVNDLGGTEMGDPPDFAKALGDRDKSRPVVLMAHQPVAAVEAAPFGVDLQVSGHTHGGQMAPFNLLVKLQQPVVSGLGKVDGVPVYVTNGAGFWGPPVRVGAPPQVTVIELRAG